MSSKSTSILCLTLAIILTQAALGICGEGAEILAGVPNEELTDPGDVATAQRIAAIIRRLEGETLEQSLANIDYVDDYYYPGYDPQGPDPLAEVKRVLSNRRFGKIYAELRLLGSHEQYVLLERHFRRLLDYYRDTLSRFKISEPAPSGQDWDIFLRISEREGWPRTRAGTRHGLQAIAILTGLLGNVEMWWVVKESFATPHYGFALKEEDYHLEVLDVEKNRPVFPPCLRGNVLFLMSQALDQTKAALAGIDTGAILAVLPEGSARDVDIYDYRTSVTKWDVLHWFAGFDIDKRYPPFVVKMVMMEDAEKLAKLISGI